MLPSQGRGRQFKSGSPLIIISLGFAKHPYFLYSILVIVFLLQIFFGFTSFAGGIAAGVFGFKQEENNQIPWLIAVSLLLICAGAFLLYKASRFADRKREFEESEGAHPSENILLKTNEMLSDYIKSADKKEKMQTLKMVASAEEQMNDQKKIGS